MKDILLAVSSILPSVERPVCNSFPRSSSSTILLILSPPPLPRRLDNFIAALLIRSGVHNNNVALDDPPFVTLSCIS